MDGRVGTNGFGEGGASRPRTAETSQINGLNGTGVRSMPSSRRASAALMSRRRAKMAGLLIVCATAVLVVSAFAMLPASSEKSAPEKTLSRPPGFPFLVFGYVFDTDGVTPLVGANVTITNLNTTEFNYNDTDDSGFYSIDVNQPLYYPTQYNTGNIINITVTYGTKVGWNEGFTNDPDAVFLWLDVTVVDLAIPEFQTLILPVMGMAAMVIVVHLSRRKAQ